MLRMTILSLALLAFSLSWLLFLHRRRGAPPSCCSGDDCLRVLQSPYARLLGVSNETLGILFFGAVALLTLLPLFEIKSIAGVVAIEGLLTVLSGVAAAYALVLTGIQLLVLKARCDYCLVSSGIGILIFSLTLFS